MTERRYVAVEEPPVAVMRWRFNRPRQIWHTSHRDYTMYLIKTFDRWWMLEIRTPKDSFHRTFSTMRQAKLWASYYGGAQLEHGPDRFAQADQAVKRAAT